MKRNKKRRVAACGEEIGGKKREKRVYFYSMAFGMRGGRKDG